MIVWAAIGGCGLVPERGRAPVVPPGELYVEAADQVLPGGIIGTVYTAALIADGGVPPYTWLAADPVPAGLVLGADGEVSGTPVEAGTSTFGLIVTDAEGRTKRMLATFTAVLVPELLRCGDERTGSFREGIFDGEPDLSRLDDFVWFAIEVPHDETTRIDVVVEATGDVAAWMQRSNNLLGSWDPETYLQRTVEGGEPARHMPVDAGTDPSLTEFATQSLLPLLLAPKDGSDWTLQVVCSKGPIFETLDKNPKMVGEPFLQDYQVFGDNTDVRIWTDDPLPAWMVWDEATGSISGTAEEPGSWPFTIKAQGADGHLRAEAALLAVYDTTDAPCGSTLPVFVTEGWREGEEVKRYDPRGYQVFRVPMDGLPEVSAVDLVLRGSDGHFLGVSSPDPGWQRFYGSTEVVEVTGEDGHIRVDSTSYPSTRRYVDAGELWFNAGSIGVDFEGLEVEVSCEYDPRPDVPGLPILAEFQAVDLALGGVGGFPPYRWSATGLPGGLVLSETGQVTGSTTDTGSHLVTFSVTDVVGSVGHQDLTWTVGSAHSCLGYRELSCGQGLDAELTATAEDGGADSRDTFCVLDTSQDLGLVIEAQDGAFRLAMSDPGVFQRDQIADPVYFTWVGEIERNQVIGFSFDEFSFPARPDYVDRALFVTVYADDPGWYAIDLECPVFGTE